MDTDRFDAMTRWLDLRSRRRRLLGTLPGAAVAFASLALLSDAEAKKRKKKKKKQGPDCPTCPPPPPPPPPALTCAETCPSNCNFCISRPDAPTMCVGGINTNCSTACTSDDQCIGNPSGPYCASGAIDRATGMPPGSFCQGIPTPGGFCASMAACP